jgi:hypothetical protein
MKDSALAQINTKLPKPVSDIMFRPNPSIEGVRALLFQGMDINSLKRADRYTLLMRAAAPAHRNAGLTQFLLEQGADVNAQDVCGHSALIEAVVSQSEEVLEVLLKGGANPNVQNCDGTAPLHLAAGRGYTTLVAKLLSTGADPNLQDRGGRTPLHQAAAEEREAIVRLLLDHGAHIDAMDLNAQTPLSLATLNGCTRAAGVLRLHCADRAFDHGDNDPYVPAFTASMNALAHGCPGIFLYVGGGYRVLALDEETGLPVQGTGSVIVRRLSRRVEGHNDGVREFISLHGLPWNSRLPWLDDIFHAYDRRMRYQASILSVSGRLMVASDGVTTLSLREPSTSWSCCQPLVLRSPKLWPEDKLSHPDAFKAYTTAPAHPRTPRPVLGQHWSAQPRSRDVTYWGDKSWVQGVEVLWGPTGSELAFFNELRPDYDPRKRQYCDAVLDLQLGLWLSSKRGGDWEKRMQAMVP